MKTFSRALLILLAVYLAASLVASLLCQFGGVSTARAIVNSRYGLLIGNWDSYSDTFAILSPFNNHPDVFLLVVDFTEGIELYSDGFDHFCDF